MPFRAQEKGVTVQIRLTPGARKTGLTGLMDIGEGKTALKVAVNVPPEDGKANKALIALLAKEWKLPKNAISLVSGAASRHKVVFIEGDAGALLLQFARYIENSGFKN